MPRRLRTTEQYGDIKTKLDSEATEHNGLTYYHFDLMCRKNVPKTVIARLFNMRAAKTIEEWQSMREEMNNERD